MIDTRNGLDIFGDIHGRAKALAGALTHLGYRKKGEVWRHPGGRRALFLGDLIDRGEANRAVVEIVRTMMEKGEALCLMGNHELNAVHFATPKVATDGTSSAECGYLRPRNIKNTRQHGAFLAEHGLLDSDGRAVDDETPAYGRDIEWFRALPLAADLPGLRAVHAAWIGDDAATIKQYAPDWRLRTDAQWAQAADAKTPLGAAVAQMLKGPEITLPETLRFRDPDGTSRRTIRLRWWDSADADSLGEAVIAKESIASALMNVPLSPKHRAQMRVGTHTAPIIEKPDDATLREDEGVPVVFGHYWRNPIDGRPTLLGPSNRLCLDFSIGREMGGLLDVYRWDGEREFNAARLYGVDRHGGVVR